MQITCLKYVLKQKYGQSHAILCGDFNIFPDTSPYIFATTGSLSVEQWESVCEQAKIQVRNLTSVLSCRKTHFSSPVQMYKKSY